MGDMLYLHGGSREETALPFKRTFGCVCLEPIRWQDVENAVPPPWTPCEGPMAVLAVLWGQ